MMVKLLLMFGADPTMPLGAWDASQGFRTGHEDFLEPKNCNVEKCPFCAEKITLHPSHIMFSPLLRKDHWGRTAYYYGRNQEDILQVFERCLDW